MKTFFKPLTILLLAGTMIFPACERVIDIDLNETNQQIVIDASLHQGVQDFKVKIYKTTSFYFAEAPQVVDTAKVYLSENGGERIILTPVSDGIYILRSFEGKVNATYTLSVIVGEEEFLATARLPEKVDINNITWVKHEGGLKGDGDKLKYTLFCEFSDPLIQPNYYMIVATDKKSKQENFWLSNDENSNGQEKKTMLRQQLYDAGDTVLVELHAVDQGVHQFYQTLSDIISNSVMNSAAPSNPDANFSNGALGCFDVYSSTQKSIVLPE